MVYIVLMLLHHHEYGVLTLAFCYSVGHWKQVHVNDGTSMFNSGAMPWC